MHVLVFPGQGAEMPGMGVALMQRSARRRQLLELASEVVGLDVVRAIERGGRALERTEVLQPVLVAVGLGAAYALEEVAGPPSLVLGHSLGELAAALYARGVGDEVALRVARARGEAMAEAARGHPGGMLATRGEPETLERARSLGLSIAAENAPDEVVVAGALPAIRTLAGELGHRAQLLRVAGPWHAATMASAAPSLEAALAGKLGDRRVGFVSATTGTLVDASHDIERALVEGLFRPVRFTEALSTARKSSAHFVAVSPGRLMRGLVRRNLGLEALCLDDASDLEVTARALC
jgi:[acyl-carrier-protein] S-malonyltransferase